MDEYSKKVNITGNNNKYMIKNIENGYKKEIKKRVVSEKWSFSEEYYEYEYQIKLIEEIIENKYLTNINVKWLSITPNTPYILLAFDSNIYSKKSDTVTYNYKTNVTYTSSPGLFSDVSYVLVKVNNLHSPNFIRIDSQTGVLSFNAFSINKSSVYVDIVFEYYRIDVSYYGYNTNTFTLNVTINANVCFLEVTPVLTDQGVIDIDKIIPEIHTIQNKKIIAITKTVSEDEYLICFEKNALGYNIPSERTIISKNHLVFNKEKMIKAEEFMKEYENVHKIKYSREPLYNVLMEKHDKILVNNLICETLNPISSLAQLYINPEEFYKKYFQNYYK